VGAGGSLEASFHLTGPIPAGNWHLIGDGETLDPCDVTFAVLWRSNDGKDHPIVSFTHSFAASGPPVNGYPPAIAYEADAIGATVPAQANDLLVLRFTATGNPADRTLFIPNGDGVKSGGRIPSLTLP
jgi:hypothetical protein